MYKQQISTESVKSLGGGGEEGWGDSHIKVTGMLVEKLKLNP